MDYKNIIQSPKRRKQLLRVFRWVPDAVMLRIQYRIKMGFWPCLRHPTRFTEKVQLYKMNYRNPIMSHCVDKYEIRDYVKNKGLEWILNTVYGVYNNPNEIVFEKLPKSFVLKTTTGGGGLNVIIVRDVNMIDKEDVVNCLSSWLKDSMFHFSPGREWAYTGISKPRIVIEKYLENPFNPEAGIEDYKILCFEGKPVYIIVDVERFIDHKRNIYTTDWTRLDVTTDHEQTNKIIERPTNLDEMLRVASILASDFPFVRVDLYNLAGKIVFGELTFYPWSGYVKFIPDEFDITLGSLMNESLFQD